MGKIPVTLYDKIFYLASELHNLCDDMQSPEEVRRFQSMTVSQVATIKKVMFLTMDEPEGVALKTLAQEMGVSPASMSEQVNVLVNKGLLEREQSKADRRAVCIRLSKYSQRIIAKLHEYLDLHTKEFMTEVGAENAQLLSELLNQFIIKIEAARTRIKK